MDFHVISKNAYDDECFFERSGMKYELEPSLERVLRFIHILFWIADDKFFPANYKIE